MSMLYKKYDFDKFMNLLSREYKSTDEKFATLAYQLMNYLCLDVCGKLYRIIEVEIYYNEKLTHPDPYVTCAKNQLTAGHWFFNGFGLDITIGNEEKKIYGGILIRGMRSIEDKPQYFSGPATVLNEIFANIGNIVNEESGFCFRDLNKDVIKEMEPIKSTRIGLTQKPNDVNNFYDKKYRYIVELNLLHKFKEKEQIVRQLVMANKITKEKAKEFLGYFLKM